MFKGLDLLMTVSLSRTDIAELPSFEDKKYYENLFIDGIPNLASLDDNLAGSTVRWVHATNLPNFALDVSSFARTRQLEAVWVGGSTTCNVTLPHEAACIDHRCNFVGHLTADTFIDRIFNKGTCQNPYEIVPGCGHLPCFPRSCIVPASAYTYDLPRREVSSSVPTRPLSILSVNKLNPSTSRNPHGQRYEAWELVCFQFVSLNW